jgi:PAS domain-containing protein
VLRPSALVLLLALAGCGAPGLPAPRSAVAAYLSALERDDPHAAWALLSDPVRARLREPAFRERWSASADERKAQAAALKAALDRGGPLDEWASVVFPDGQRVPVAREAGAWRLTSTSLDQAHAATPAEALERLADAIAARRFDQVLSLLAEPLRGAVEHQLAERIERLRAALASGQPIEVVGDRALLQYDPRFRVELRREGGEWRVLDLN